MSPIAGRFVGTYGSLVVAVGSGRLTRLRDESVGSFQFFSMNFRIETWSV